MLISFESWSLAISVFSMLVPLAVLRMKAQGSNRFPSPGAYTTLLKSLPVLIPMCCLGITILAKDEATEFMPKCARTANPSFLKRYLMQGWDVNMRDKQDKSNKTLLMIAAESGNASVVRLLLSYRADVSLKDSVGKTALEISIANKLLHPEQSKRYDLPIELLNEKIP